MRIQKCHRLKSYRSLLRYRKRKCLSHQRARQIIFHHDMFRQCKFQKPHIVVLTGAGISAESGIRTFRASDGLWEEHKIEDVATPEGYARQPELVQQFYNQRRRQLSYVEPNPAHIALAELEQKLGDHFLLITQNVDDLHERAGNQRIIHMHGELLKVRCVCSGQVYSWIDDVTAQDHCQCCQPPQPLRPHIVWFGEIPLEMERIYRALEQADIFISIGTSGNVYPAAEFVEIANQYQVYTVELNLEPSQVESKFKEKCYGKASEIVPNYLGTLFGEVTKSCNFSS